jgi:SAM-dependent methyltransferase
MDNPKSIPLKRLQEILKFPQAFVEREFSPYFYRYFVRYGDPNRFKGYLDLCRYILKTTGAEKGAVLDLGCGFGMMAIVLRLLGAEEVVGCDANTEKIDLFSRLLSYLDGQVNNVRPILGDSSRMEYPDGSFDVVLANEVLSHVKDLEGSISEAYRVLKPGGRLMIRDGNNSLFLPGRLQRRKFWKRVEEGPVDPSWFRGTDIVLPFGEVRKRMITEKFPNMSIPTAEKLSRMTVGMYGNQILDAAKEFEETGRMPSRPEFRFRNPVTGEYPENEINPFRFRTFLKTKGFDVSIVPFFYSASMRTVESAAKRFLYLTARCLPAAHLFFNPGFAFLCRKTEKKK